MEKENLKIFTIIMCAYNADDRIKESINSVLNQERFDQLVERFLLVDNNSNDSTPKIMLEYSQENKKVDYIKENKQGLSFARQAGLKVAETPWIIFVDDDNILEPNWLIESENYIKSKKDVGAFNGAVIPYIDWYLTDEEEIRLEVALGNLACTHLNVEKINLNENVHPHGTPFGAGLVIRREPLKKLSDNGWLKLEGRNEKRLSSGEDTEMCLYIKQQGFQFGYNPKMLIKHKLPKKRIDEKYLLKLNEGISESAYNLFNSDLPYLSVLYMSLKSLIKYLIIFSKYTLAGNDYKLKFKYKMDLHYRKVIIKKGLMKA
jgi:glucosyl-dolichyl phosphate glucuronosyltransferase